MFYNCAASRGQTYCAHGTCYCDTGYCRYPTETVHATSRYCVALIPGETCDNSYGNTGGCGKDAFCNKGYCMCDFGYKVEHGENHYKCVVDDEMPTLAVMLAGNITQDERAMLLGIQKEQMERATTA